MDRGRPRRSCGAGRRGRRRGTRHAAPAGRGMTLDEDLEEAATGAEADLAVGPGLRRARAWLSRVVEPGTIDFWRYVEDVGPVEAVRRLRAGRAPERVRSLVGARAEQDATLADMTRAERCGARLVIPEDDEWPAVPLHALTVAVGAEPDDPSTSRGGRWLPSRRWRCGYWGRSDSTSWSTARWPSWGRGRRRRTASTWP